MIESAGGTTRIVIAGRAATELTLAGLTVLVEDGPDKGAIARLGSTGLCIGTGRENDLVLTDGTVSRRHAVLTRTADGILVEDLGSTNGTTLNGARIRTAFVPDGGLLMVGSTRLRVRGSTERLTVFPDEKPEFAGVLAQSEAMREVLALVRQLARTDLPVLITGESGTGKERIARALHDAGPRAKHQLLVLDCGSVVPDLLRSELFGHERGAFTGADRAVKGILEEAEGGTVFLDEIGELDIAVQPNLLRAVETREVTRLGSRKAVPVNFRLVSATNRDLGRSADEGRFRRDLLYRLACVTIRLPPLRERPDDIPLLAQHFVRECARRHGLAEPNLEDGAVDTLRRHAWPGNVRELRNVLDALTALSGGGPITAPAVAKTLAAQPSVGVPAAASAAPTSPAVPGPESLEAAEKNVLLQALASTGWNKKAAARQLGISHTTMFEKIKRYGLKPPSEG